MLREAVAALGLAGAAATAGCSVTGRTVQPVIGTLKATPGSSDPRTIGPLPAPTVTGGLLTNRDDRGIFRTRVGHRIVIDLQPTLGSWDRPQAGGADAVRLISVTGAYPSSGSLRAVYTATAPGETTITTQTDLGCFHARPPCAVAVQEWQVRVIVRP